VADLTQEHRVLLATLEAGDAEGARSTWSAHFDDSERFFLDLIKERTR
jgi:DNA-binding FadR family transcriptional regulator